MSDKLNSAIAVIGIDIGKNSFHLVGHDKRGAIMLRQKWSRGRSAAEQGYERAPVHSITSSARASTVAGMSRPSALAVLRLMTKSNLVGCCMGS
jgi:hypothetical protein